MVLSRGKSEGKVYAETAPRLRRRIVFLSESCVPTLASRISEDFMPLKLSLFLPVGAGRALMSSPTPSKTRGTFFPWAGHLCANLYQGGPATQNAMLGCIAHVGVCFRFFVVTISYQSNKAFSNLAKIGKAQGCTHVFGNTTVDEMKQQDIRGALGD